MKVKSQREVSQSCLTLSDPMDCSLPGSSVHGICQARVLEWVAIAFSRIFSLPIQIGLNLQILNCSFRLRCFSALFKGIYCSNSQLYTNEILSFLTPQYTLSLLRPISLMYTSLICVLSHLHFLAHTIFSWNKFWIFSLLLLLSCFSCVRLCVTPETTAHQAPLSLGFSRQEHWSGLPFPSPM